MISYGYVALVDWNKGQMREVSERAHCAMRLQSDGQQPSQRLVIWPSREVILYARKHALGVGIFGEDGELVITHPYDVEKGMRVTLSVR